MGVFQTQRLLPDKTDSKPEKPGLKQLNSLYNFQVFARAHAQ